MPRPLILFVHITAAMGVFAAMGIEGVALLQLRRASSLAQLQAAVNGLRLMQRVMALSALTLVLSGLYLAGSAWGWSVPWINLGFASLVAAAVLGGATTGRTIGRVQAGASDQLRAPLLGISYRTRIAMLIGIVYLMTVKPALGESLIVMAAATAVGLAFGLRCLRLPVTPLVEG